MNPYAKIWDEVVIRLVFSANLASKIMNTPLIDQVQNDCLIWKAKKNGRLCLPITCRRSQ